MAFFDEGIYDPATGLLSPLYFYESAARLISWADRTQRQTALISIKLRASSDDQINDDEVVECAALLSAELRGGDLLARMGERLFVLLLLGNQLAGEQLVFRLKNTLQFQLDFQVTALEHGENVSDGLERLGV